MIAGTMAIHRFPLWEKCLRSLAERVDKVYIRFDMTGDITIPRRLPEILGGKFGHCRITSSPWDPFSWREDLLRMLDDVKPSAVLNMDEDEEFGPGFDADFAAFMQSKWPQLAFRYKFPMPTEDGWQWHKVMPYHPHVKVFKWRPGLTFLPYKKRARLSNYGPKEYELAGNCEILHYCFWNKEIREKKLLGKKAKIKWSKKQARKL